MDKPKTEKKTTPLELDCANEAENWLDRTIVKNASIEVEGSISLLKIKDAEYFDFKAVGKADGITLRGLLNLAAGPYRPFIAMQDDVRREAQGLIVAAQVKQGLAKYKPEDTKKEKPAIDWSHGETVNIGRNFIKQKFTAVQIFELAEQREKKTKDTSATTTAKATAIAQASPEAMRSQLEMLGLAPELIEEHMKAFTAKLERMEKMKENMKNAA